MMTATLGLNVVFQTDELVVGSRRSCFICFCNCDLVMCTAMSKKEGASKGKKC